MDAERFISSSMNAGEEETEVSLRPKTFTDYVGQEKIKSNLAKSTNVRYNRIPRLMDQKIKGEETNERQRV